MATLTEAVAAIERHIAFPYSRLKQVSRRLQDAEVLPLGSPGASPEVSVEHVLSLIVAMAADTTLRQSAAAVELYGSLAPDGAALSNAPVSIVRSADVALLSLAKMAVHGEPCSSLSIEVVSTWPEVALHWADGIVQRFREAGALSSHWADGRQRRSTKITGSAFAAVFKELFA